MAPERIVILTGAGLSAESGLGTFRGKGGLWDEYDLEEVATPEGFARNPVKVHDFYNMRRRWLREACPNAAHFALAKLEREHSGEVLIVTQNIDPLHEAAGSKAPIHMHGELASALCAYCCASRPWTEDLSLATDCPACAVRHGMRPDVVWFGEMPREMERDLAQRWPRRPVRLHRPAAQSTLRRASSPRLKEPAPTRSSSISIRRKGRASSPKSTTAPRRRSCLPSWSRC